VVFLVADPSLITPIQAQMVTQMLNRGKVEEWERTWKKWRALAGCSSAQKTQRRWIIDQLATCQFKLSSLNPNRRDHGQIEGYRYW